MLPPFWRGRRVFVTGHTGFKGSWLSLWLQSLGADVVGFALDPPTQPSLFVIADVGRDMGCINGNVQDLDALCRALQDSRPEIVFHLAAQSLVRQSYEEPVQTYATNVMGTAHILEAARRTGSVRAVVVVTSDKCYENQERLEGYREDEPMGGHDPYSSSKGCAELVTAAYRNSFFRSSMPGMHVAAIATARAGNVIGGGDWGRDRLIPDIVRSFSDSRPVPIRNPDAIRPWQHVLEPLGGYLLLAERLFARDSIASGAWNFGPYDSDSKTVKWIVDTMAEEWGDNASWRVDDGPAKRHEAHLLALNIAKATTELGWVPRWDLRTALRSIVEWHKAHAAGADMRRVVLNQIDRFAATESSTT